MVNAKSVCPPKLEFHRTDDCISIVRDHILFRLFPKQLKFQLDRIGEKNKADEEYRDIVKNAKVKTSIYGVFGYMKMKTCSYLILIEEASVVGSLLRGTVLKVEKLMFVPLKANTKMTVD